MRLGLAEAAGRPILIAQHKQEVLSPAETSLPDVLVSADEVPDGGLGLRITTRLNGKAVQVANTDDPLFQVPELIARVSEAMMLKPGDILVTGTPAGVGFARKPPWFRKHGDVCEIEVEGIGLLRNPIIDERAA